MSFATLTPNQIIILRTLKSLMTLDNPFRKAIKRAIFADAKAAAGIPPDTKVTVSLSDGILKINGLPWTVHHARDAQTPAPVRSAWFDIGLENVIEGIVCDLDFKGGIPEARFINDPNVHTLNGRQVLIHNNALFVLLDETSFN